MSKQLVDSERIEATITKLRTVNSTINKEFGTLEKTAKRLDSDWNSGAGATARTTMYQLFKSNESRSNVLQNYINTLELQVNPAYIDAESVNTQLADKFK